MTPTEIPYTVINIMLAVFLISFGIILLIVKYIITPCLPTKFFERTPTKLVEWMDVFAVIASLIVAYYISILFYQYIIILK
jgi:Fe2+ transport system protein B